jgi:hypothetical protein
MAGAKAARGSSLPRAEGGEAARADAPEKARKPAGGRTAPQPAPVERGPRFLVGVDGISGTLLQGWAVDLADTRAPVWLRLEAKGGEVFRFATREHRPDIGAVLEGNVAGFSLDLAALPAEAAGTLAQALEGVPLGAPASPRLAALRVVEDGSLIDLGAFGVTVGDLLLALGNAVALPGASRPKALASREARARDWLLAFLGGAAQARPARRFADRLLADIEASPAVSAPVKRHAADIAPLFDPFHYLDRVAAPQEAVANPLLHYVLAGWRDGVSPSPLFSPPYYKRLRGLDGGDPLLDFVREGAPADPHPLFDVAFYRAQHLGGDAGANPLAHYLESGGRARLDPSPLFDTSGFLAAFGLSEETDVALETFVLTPEYYGFSVSPAFDAALYRYQVEIELGEKLAEPPFAHYLAHGFRDETLLPNLLFDPVFYREHNRLTLAEPALAHYLREGEAAGLTCHPVFSAEFYNKQREIEGGVGALAHALAHPGQVRSLPRMESPIDPRLVALVGELVAENGVEDFRADIYRDANPDLGAIDDSALEAHYRSRGARAQRIGSLTRMMRLSEMRVRDLPLGFVLDDYVGFYPDLGVFKGRLTSALYHYGRYGRHERRMIGKWLFKFADLDIDLPSPAEPLRVARQVERVEACILIHAFYPDLLPELVAFAQNFREASFDIFINVVDAAWTPALQEQLRAICPGAFLMLSNDLGRDIGGFTRLLEHVDIAHYDVFAFMHSKKSPHIAAETGEYWRRSLLNVIAGSPETARDCLKLFRDDPRIGMIGAKEWRSHDMGENIDQYERLLDLLGVRGDNRDVDYLSGFMFLMRSEIVAQLFTTLRKLEFEDGTDKDIEFHKDGQIAHGVERAVPALVRQMGYDVLWR